MKKTPKSLIMLGFKSRNFSASVWNMVTTVSKLPTQQYPFAEWASFCLYHICRVMFQDNLGVGGSGANALSKLMQMVDRGNTVKRGELPF
jgi:hypothetical protein